MVEVFMVSLDGLRPYLSRAGTVELNLTHSRSGPWINRYHCRRYSDLSRTRESIQASNHRIFASSNVSVSFGPNSVKSSDNDQCLIEPTCICLVNSRQELFLYFLQLRIP